MSEVKNMSRPKTGLTLFLFAIATFITASFLFAHCDTLTGPVIMDAKKALESGNVSPVLKWIKEEYESEVTYSFKKALEVRQLNGTARELADYYFFETVVRLHRAGEGVPYSGISNEVIEPIIVEADKALNTGSVDVLLRMLTSEVEDRLRHRFSEVVEKKKNGDRSVKDGREYVKAYVEFVHYVEALHRSEMKEEHSH